MSEHDTERDEQTDDRGDQDGDQAQDDVDVSSGGVAVEGYETHNLPPDKREAVMTAESPDDVSDDLIKEIEEERDRRLDPENRPEGAEVDNTKRTFVPAEAKFEDSDIDQDPELGQDLPPVGGDAGAAPTRDDSDDSSDSSDSSDSGNEGQETSRHDEESGDPKDDTATQTSGTDDPTAGDDSGDDAGDNDSGDAEPAKGRHRA